MRLNWEEIEARPRQEGRNVVKGTNKRVVVVKSPDPRVFEQAIFIVRNDALREGVTARALVQEARRVARNCATGRTDNGGLWERFLPWITAFIGGGFVGVAWLLVTFFTL